MDNFKRIEEQLIEIKSLLHSQKKVLNFNEVVAYTGLSSSYLYKLTSTGGIPCYKPQGKHIYFDKSEIDGWLLSNRKATKNELDARACDIVTNRLGGVKC